MKDTDELKGAFIGFIILVLIVAAALMLGGNPSDQSADPACATSGNC